MLRKGIIIELVIIVVFVALAIFMYSYDKSIDLIFFEIYSQKDIDDKGISLEQKVAELEQKRTVHSTALTSLETAKSDYKTQKEKYQAISEDTISTINTATQGEEYNLDYMWITLGNYAKHNNLSILLYEPDAEVNLGTSSENLEETDEDEETVTESVQVGIDSVLADRSDTNLRVKVEGTYTNVSEFFYDVETDPELRFNLDNIRMEYAGSGANNIVAIFEVKGLVFNK